MNITLFVILSPHQDSVAEQRSASGHRQNEKNKPHAEHKPRTPTAARLTRKIADLNRAFKFFLFKS